MTNTKKTDRAVHFDFDQFLREQAKEPIVIRIFGKEEELPAELPAMILLRISDLQEKGADKTSMRDVFDMAYAVFGEERVKSWMYKGISVNGLEVLLKEVMSVYTGEMGGDGDKSPRPE
jgi:hypothetical protein